MHYCVCVYIFFYTRDIILVGDNIIMLLN